MTHMTQRVKTRAAHVAVVGDGADSGEVVDGSVAESGTCAFESEDVGMGTIRSVITSATAWSPNTPPTSFVVSVPMSRDTDHC